MQSYEEHLCTQIRELIASRALPGEETPGAIHQEHIMQKLSDCLTRQVRERELTVELLAKLMHMSRPTLYRKMKTITHLTPNELITEARLIKAAGLLAAGMYRPFEVARLLGYTSQSSFGKSFLKQFKVTPAAYQRMKK